MIICYNIKEKNQNYYFYFVTRDTETKSKHKTIFIKTFPHKLMNILFLLTGKDIIKPRTNQINWLSFSPLLPIQVRQKKVWAGTLHALKPPVRKIRIPSKRASGYSCMFRLCYCAKIETKLAGSVSASWYSGIIHSLRFYSSFHAAGGLCG